MKFRVVVVLFNFLVRVVQDAVKLIPRELVHQRWSGRGLRSGCFLAGRDLSKGQQCRQKKPDFHVRNSVTFMPRAQAALEEKNASREAEPAFL
jgi:hypothetical protein